jgi:hypothetical protein
MQSDYVRDTLRALESQFLKDHIIHQLCLWNRCRDDTYLLSALSLVQELVSIEDSNQIFA